jgi:hypothetical protein
LPLCTSSLSPHKTSPCALPYRHCMISPDFLEEAYDSLCLLLRTRGGRMCYWT